ncbi:hypothetical protein [Catenovulum adriaticum]|uniref:Flagellar hook-length control protein FliK n=1 Tax=Catenovulum adriaticum TaxID=2984846 RepID=A0ABY7AI25_9ALTE|nr:hypothetical protein [Catenovulum sp. TS8]WAJ69262.1 hypothetical protein OLW01_08690 [Catenovulum sp. TS8]
MVEPDYLQKSLQKSTPNLASSTQRTNALVPYAQIQDNIRQAALHKVNQVISQLQFPSGQKIDIKLNPNQQSQLNNIKQVDVSLQQQTLTISPSKTLVTRQPLTSIQVNHLAQHATKTLEPNQIKGHLVTASVKQNQAEFVFEDKHYRLPLPHDLTHRKQLSLIVKPEAHGLNISIVNHPKHQNMVINAQINQPKADTYLVKNILIEQPNISFTLANTPIKLKLENSANIQLNQVNGWQLANLTVKGEQGELQLANNEKYSFILPVKQMAQQTLSQLSHTPKALFELLAIKNPTADLPLNQNDKLKFSLQSNPASSNKPELVIQYDKSISIQIKITDELRNQLINSQLFQLKSPLVQAQVQPKNEISPAALLKQLNQTTDHKQTLSLSQIQNIRQLAHQVQQNDLSESLQFLFEKQSTLQNTLTRLSKGLDQLKLPTSAEQVQSQIKTQIQLPSLVANLSTNPLQPNTGLATQLLQALQILFKAKTNTRQASSESQLSSKNSSQGQVTAQKSTQSAAQALKHFQINQIKSAEHQTQGQNQIFASLPFMQNNQIDYAQLALQCEADEFEDEHKQAIKLWKFSLKFNFEEHGKLLIKAALIDDTLKLNIYCEADSLNQVAQAKINELKKRLSHFNLNLEETGFNIGKIPEQLWQETAITMQYRL